MGNFDFRYFSPDFEGLSYFQGNAAGRPGTLDIRQVVSLYGLIYRICVCAKFQRLTTPMFMAVDVVCSFPANWEGLLSLLFLVAACEEGVIVNA